MNILIINGSTHEHSLNLRAARVSEKAVKATGNAVTLIHLGKENLPMFRGYDKRYPKRVKEILQLMMKADGFILHVPEYHHAVPAALKSLFEYIDDEETYVIRDRPVAMISASPGQFGGVRAQHSLYGLLRTLGLWLVPDELFLPRAHKIFLDDGTITDEKIKQRIEKLAKRLVRVAELLKPLRGVRGDDTCVETTPGR